MIPIPDLRQEKGSSDCGRVVAHCVWELRGVNKRQVPCTPLDGTSPDTLEAVLRQSGLRICSGNMAVEDLWYFTDRGSPVICLLSDDGEGHWVIVTRVQDSRVEYHCPHDGPKTETVGTFAARWFDYNRFGYLFKQWGIAVGDVV